MILLSPDEKSATRDNNEYYRSSSSSNNGIIGGIIKLSSSSSSLLFRFFFSIVVHPSFSLCLSVVSKREFVLLSQEDKFCNSKPYTLNNSFVFFLL